MSGSLITTFVRTIEVDAFADRPPLFRLPSIAHHLSRSVYKFKREGTLEAAGPAGVNAVQVSRRTDSNRPTSISFQPFSLPQALIQEMANQLGAMERVVRTRELFQTSRLLQKSFHLTATPLSRFNDSSPPRLHRPPKAVRAAVSFQLAPRSRG